MSKKKLSGLSSLGGLVYSTDPNFQLPGNEPEAVETVAAASQKLRVILDKKQRAGKMVTLVEGFVGTQEDMEQLGKSLKALCGTGGSVKDGEILVQGDHRDKVLQWLLKQGYKQSKRVG